MEGTTHPVYGDGGYLNKSVNVSFPLSPKKMLLLTYHKHQRSIWETPRQYVEAVNRARAAHAELELYSHIRHKTLAKMALKYKDSRPGIRISGGGPKNFAKVVSPRRFAP